MWNLNKKQKTGKALSKCELLLYAKPRTFYVVKIRRQCQHKIKTCSFWCKDPMAVHQTQATTLNSGPEVTRALWVLFGISKKHPFLFLKCQAFIWMLPKYSLWNRLGYPVWFHTFTNILHVCLNLANDGFIVKFRNINIAIKLQMIMCSLGTDHVLVTVFAEI